jgi:hypothetical protein
VLDTTPPDGVSEEILINAYRDQAEADLIDAYDAAVNAMRADVAVDE